MCGWASSAAALTVSTVVGAAELTTARWAVTK